jgi:predicted short-subunit dehydrogenase-like oxidoreductase (DUF2520 family)
VTRGTGQPRAPAPVLIVGCGRLGGALALGLQRARWPVAVLPHSARSERHIRALGLGRADERWFGRAELCILAVPDSAIAQAAQIWAARLRGSAALVHCSGALALSALGRVAPHPRGSFHPLCAISDPRDVLTGCGVALSASTVTLRRSLRRMAAALGLIPFSVPEERRALYHAGAVLGAGGMVALAAEAERMLVLAGVPKAVSRRILPRLTASAFTGVAQKGAEEGLTGPVRRGDVAVVARHLAALPSDAWGLYRALSNVMLRLAAGALSGSARRALRNVIGRKGPESTGRSG